MDIKEQQNGLEHKEEDSDFHLPYYGQRDNNVFNSLEVSNNDVFEGSKDQLVEEQVVVSDFVVNNFQEIFDVLVYDNYGDNFLEHPLVGFPSENYSFQKIYGQN